MCMRTRIGIDTPRALAVAPDGATVYAAVFLSGNQTVTVPEEAVCDGFRPTDGVDACPGELAGSPGGNPGPATDGRITFRPEHLRTFHFNERSLATVALPGAWYYVKPDGRYAAAVTNDNGPDYFVEGLARALINGKMAYFNEELEVVLQTSYDWAWPFDDGDRAMVCNGCRVEDSDEDSHKAMVGGQWGYIDRQGKEVVPVRFTRDELWEMRRQ